MEEFIVYITDVIVINNNIIELNWIFKIIDSCTQVDKDNDINQWNNLLLHVQSKSRKKLPENKNVLLLGDSKSGKTTLVTKLQGLKDSKQGWGMEYGYIQVRWLSSIFIIIYLYNILLIGTWWQYRWKCPVKCLDFGWWSITKIFDEVCIKWTKLWGHYNCVGCFYEASMVNYGIFRILVSKTARSYRHFKFKYGTNSKFQR